MRKKLTKDKSNSLIFGVCSGISNYFNIDVSIIRIGLIIFTIVFNGGIILYLFAALIIPEN